MNSQSDCWLHLAKEADKGDQPQALFVYLISHVDVGNHNTQIDLRNIEI